mgnify:CR=1 FL=1
MLLSALVIKDPVPIKVKYILEEKLDLSFEPESDWESSLRGSEAEIICARSVSDWFNSGHLQISFSHLWILSLYYFSLHWMIHNDVTFSLLTVRFLPWCHNVAFSTLMAFSIVKLHFTSLFLTLMLHFLPRCHSVAFSTSMQHFLI